LQNFRAKNSTIKGFFDFFLSLISAIEIQDLHLKAKAISL
jgi:hypothetical protein